MVGVTHMTGGLLFSPVYKELGVFSILFLNRFYKKESLFHLQWAGTTQVDIMVLEC